ncbi:unnamed protein product, partial [Allacma fusca]
SRHFDRSLKIERLPFWIL